MNPYARLVLYQKTKQIRTRPQLHTADRVAKYLIDIDYLGTYNLEETKNCKSSIFKTRKVYRFKKYENCFRTKREP